MKSLVIVQISLFLHTTALIFEENPFFSKNIKKQQQMFHQNSLHLPSRIDSFQITLNEIDHDVVVLCEHKMKISEIERINSKGCFEKVILC